MKKISILFIYIFLFILSCEDKVEKDTTPPELTIVSPTSGSTIGEIVQIKVQTTDESGILKVDFYIQNSMVLSDTTLPYEYEWNTTTNQDGEYKVKVVSFDTKENFNESEVSFIVDNNSKKPQPVNIDTVYYDTEYMYLKWTSTTDIDFKTYNIFYSDSQNGVREKIDSYDYQERSGLNLPINEYSPTKENWFFIEVVDIYGLSSIGQGKSNIQNLPPIKVNFEKVKYDVNQGGIRFEWKNTFEEDLKYLFILRSKDSNMSMTDTIYNTSNPTGFVGETWKRDIRMEPDQQFYFSLNIVDLWNQTTESDIYDYYEPIMFKKEIDSGIGYSVKPVIIQDYRYGFVVVGSEKDDKDGGDGLHKYFTLDGRVVDFSSNNKIGEGYTGYGSKIGYDVLLDNTTNFKGKEVYVMTGILGNKENNTQIFLIRENPSGVTIKFNELGYGKGNSLSHTNDNGFLVVGSTPNGNTNDIIIIKTDDNFNEVLKKQIGDENNQEGISGFETTDGGFIISGISGNYLYVIKTDNSGNKEWDLLNGDGNNLAKGHSIISTNDGFLVVGEKDSGSENGGNQLFVLKLFSNGDLDWEKTFSGTRSGNDVIESKDGNFIITGVTDKSSGGVLLMKIDSFGNEIWKKNYEFDGYDVGNSIEQYGEGGYIITGSNNSSSHSLLLIKTDLNGNIK